MPQVGLDETTVTVSGLTMTLMIEQDEYLDDLSPAAGARIIIHDPRVQAFPEEEGLNAAPGQLTSLALKSVSNISLLPLGKTYQFNSNLLF
jgi:hypothetical protein